MRRNRLSSANEDAYSLLVISRYNVNFNPLVEISKKRHRLSGGKIEKKAVKWREKKFEFVISVRSASM